MSEPPVIPPPNPLADFERRPVLYRADGKALVRAAGFVPHGDRMALQTTGTFPQLTRRPAPAKPSKGGKKGGGKRGC